MQFSFVAAKVRFAIAMTSSSSSKGTAVITGASTGIGAVYADRLAQRGYDLVVVARDVARLDALAARLTHATGREVRVIGADLTRRDDVARIEQLLTSDTSVSMLVNNAASSTGKTFVASRGEDLEQTIALNITSLARLSSAVVPGFMQRRAGTLINIGSGVVMMPEQYNAAYGASKAFVLSFTRNIAVELAPYGIHVQVVLPGAIRTEAWERSGTDIEALPPGVVMSAEDLVDAALAGLDQHEVITFPSLADLASWTAMEDARAALLPQLFRSTPAPRYTR